MMPRKKVKGEVTFVRLPPELKAALWEIADREDRPLNYIIIRTLRQAMEKADG